MPRAFIRYSSAVSLSGLGALLALPAGANSRLGVTHLLPSPRNLGAGSFLLGTTTGVGITSFLQLETQVVDDLYAIYNGRIKAALVDAPVVALAVTLAYQQLNLQDWSVKNPPLVLQSWLPGAVVGLALSSNLSFFLGGQLALNRQQLPSANLLASAGLVQGASGEADLTYFYSPSGAFSAGMSYNFSYQFYGVGLSHHWSVLQLGVHYYPNATTWRFLPIVNVGMGITL